MIQPTDAEPVQIPVCLLPSKGEDATVVRSSSLFTKGMHHYLTIMLAGLADVSSRIDPSR
jgi:hypothetical protein